MKKPRLFIVILLVGGLVAAACGGAGTPDEPQATQVKPTFDIAFEPLSGRSYLSLCVDDGTGGASDDAVETVKQALDTALAAEVYLPSQYDRREVTAGCREPSASLGTPTSEGNLHGSGTDVLSDHAVFVYLIDPSLYEATFGDDLYARGLSEERVCKVDVCMAVTRSLYVPTSISVVLLQTALADILGFIDHGNPQPVTCTPAPGINCDIIVDFE